MPNNVVEVRNSQDGSVVGVVPAHSAADVEKAVSVAVQGAVISKNWPTFNRMEVLRRAADIVRNKREHFAETIAQEGVKTIREARGEVERCAVTLQLFAEEARRLNGETIRFDQVPSGEQRFGYYDRRPLGVIAAITPFNDPLNLVAHKLAPAIATGNSVVLKPHPETPLSAQNLVNALVEAGLPEKIIQVVNGDGAETGHALVTDSRVRMVSFTGGRDTGEAITRSAGIKKLGMELGSIGSVIVMNDADQARAVDAVVSGAFWAAGQNCLHVQRVFLQDAIHDDFLEQFVQRTLSLKQGSKLDEATDMGCMINEAAAVRVEHAVKQAVESGATLHCGGTRDGVDFAPTIFSNVPTDSPLIHDEIFGPVTVVHKFSTVDQAIENYNQSRFGLHASIFTRDIATAFHASANLECGGVFINDSTDYRIDAMPFGGSKESGIGREGGRHAMEAMTEPTVVCFNLA